MADNVTIPATGSGDATPVVATDDVGGAHYQRVKIDGGGNGLAAPIGGDAANGLDVDVTRVQGTVTVDGSGVTQPVSHAALTELAAAIDTEVQVDVVGALPAGTNNIGDVDIASIAAGDNNIGNVDLASAIPAGTNNIGDVDVVGGTTAHDAAGAAVNPLPMGGYASDALPTEVSADTDIVRSWLLRVGAQVIADLPHLGLIADPFTLLNKVVQTTTQQTGSDILTVNSGKRLVVTSIQIQAGGTTAGTVQVWFGATADTTYSRGTDRAIFDGEFAPSATLKPGFALSPAKPWIGGVDEELHLTTSAAINPLTINVWYYEV